MNLKFRTGLICAVLSVSLGNYCQAVVVPFLEDFTLDAANWGDIAENPATHVPSGGPSDDAYITSSAAFSSAPVNANGIATFRAHNAYNSSADAFVGNWQTSNVTKISAYFRHHETEAGLDLIPFVRVATTSNFPAFAIEAPGTIPANEWTKIEFIVSPGNPLLTVEGPPQFYTSAITNVGNVQFGFSFPESFVGNEVIRTFDIDRVEIVPEPGTIGLLIAGIASMWVFLRKQGN